MSIPVPLDQLAEAVAEFGETGYLVTVGADGRPRVNHVRVRVVDDVLQVPVGRRTAEAIGGRPAVCCLWPAAGPGGMNLVIDGDARLESTGAGAGAGAGTVAHITVTWAVRHALPAG
jgi:hypothetical protein